MLCDIDTVFDADRDARERFVRRYADLRARGSVLISVIIVGLGALASVMGVVNVHDEDVGEAVGCSVCVDRAPAVCAQDLSARENACVAVRDEFGQGEVENFFVFRFLICMAGQGHRSREVIDSVLPLDRLASTDERAC